MRLPLRTALLPLLILGAGCTQPAAPPPAAPPAMTAPAAKAPAGMPDLPPDPRALKSGGSKSTSGTAGVATTVLPNMPIDGSALNKFFPNDQDGYNRVFTQEKKGFVLADLSKGKQKVAQLSINDCAGRPDTREKYKTASKSVAGYPAVTEGMNSGLAILVGDRYQVKIRATGGALSQEDFEAWLQKFDLAGLAALK